MAAASDPSEKKNLGVGRVVTWFTQRDAIAAADRGPAFSATQQRARERAGNLFEVVQLFSPRSATGSLPGIPEEQLASAALSLLREATYLAIVAVTDQKPGSLREAMELLTAGDLARQIGCDHLVAEASKALADRNPAECVEPLPPECVAAERAADELVELIVAHALTLERAPLRPRRRRNIHYLFAILLVALGVGGMASRMARASYESHHPVVDNAPPWRSSSAYGPFPASGREQVDRPGYKGTFFHTAQDRQPWIEFDLGQPTQVGSVEIWNRPEEKQRAVPLIVEISKDHSTWQQVARMERPFGEWRPTFDSATARYVRLKSLQESTYLHLERVIIRR